MECEDWERDRHNGLMGKASSSSSIASVLAYVASGLVGAVIAEALDDLTMLPAIGGLVVVTVVAVGLIPTNGLLRQQRLGRERWVRIAALILIVFYPLVLIWSVKGDDIYTNLAPAMSIYLAASLLAWQSLLARFDPFTVIAHVGGIGAGAAVIAIYLPSALKGDLLAGLSAIGGLLISGLCATSLKTKDSASHPVDVYFFSVLGFGFCASGLIALAQESDRAVFIMGLGVGTLSIAVAFWADSRRSMGAAFLVYSAVGFGVSISVFTDAYTFYSTYQNRPPVGVALLLAAAVFAAVGLGHLLAKWDITSALLPATGIALLAMAAPLLNTHKHAGGIAGIGLSTVLIAWGSLHIVSPQRLKRLGTWLRSDRPKDITGDKN